MCGLVSSHSGTVAVESAAKLRIVMGPVLIASPVLVASSIDGKKVSDCMTPTTSDTSGAPISYPCRFVSTVPPGPNSAITAGRATKLTVGGQPVILETQAGDTNGLAGYTNGMVNKITPQKLLAGTANQNKLTAV